MFWEGCFFFFFFRYPVWKYPCAARHALLGIYCFMHIVVAYTFFWVHSQRYWSHILAYNTQMTYNYSTENGRSCETQVNGGVLILE